MSMNANSASASVDDRFDAFRQDFPCFEKRRYMSIASRSILSRFTRGAIEAALDDQMYGRINKAIWKAEAETARSRVAQLFRVTPDEIAFTKNVSDGLNTVSNAIEWTPGDNMVCCLSYEHPNAVYTWLNLTRRGVEIRDVPMRGGRVDIAAMVRAIDSNTKLVGISAVNFASGARTDLAPLGEACRERDVLFLVDGAQSAGILDIDLRGNMVDAYAVSSNKGLLGVYGLGFLYCGARWSERLQPTYLSRFGIKAEGFEDSEVGPSDYRLYPNARRFDVGNGNYIALIAAAASVRQLLELGSQSIQEYVLNLATQLSIGLQDAGYRLEGSGQVRESHIVGIEAQGANLANVERFKSALTANDVTFAVRRGTVRFGLHAYNNASDVQTVIQLARDCAQR